MEYRLGEKTLIGLIVLLSIYGPISTDMFLPALNEMQSYFHTDAATLNMALYVFMFFMAVSVLIMGTLSDKYGRRFVLSVALVLYISMNIVCCLTDNITVFIVARALEAMGGGGAMAIALALEKDFFQGEKLNRVITITVALGVIGPIIAPVLGNAIILVSNWKWTFIAPAIFAGVCLALALMLPKELPLERYKGTVLHTITNLGQFLRHGGFTIFAIMISVFMGGQLAYVAVAPYIYENTFGFDGTQFSFAVAGTLIIAVAFMLVLKRFEQRIGNKAILMMLPAGAVLTGILLLTIGEMHWWTYTISMIPITVMAVFGRSFGYNILLNEFDHDSGSVSSLINFINYMFCCTGMVLATAPFWPNYITGLGCIALICAGVFVAMGLIFGATGCKLKAL